MARSSEILLVVPALTWDPLLGSFVETLLEGSVARGTISAYSGQIEDLKLFCTDHGYALDFTSDILALYVTSLA